MVSKPITVVVIADTHVNCISELPHKLMTALTGADVIIHLGDYVTPELLNDLRKLSTFHGIMGNHDNLIDRCHLNVTEVVEIGGKRMGLIHGLFMPIARPKRIMAMFRKHKIDILLFGHNHLAINKKRFGVLYFNPGTVTRQFPATEGSFGVLSIDERGAISSNIVVLEDQAPSREKVLMKIWAIFIRNGMRWLEAWPYIDFRWHWKCTRLRMKKFMTPKKRGR